MRAGIETRHVAATGSTNADLIGEVRAAAAAGALAFAPRLLVAGHQSAGRGRHGRHWASAAGASLTASWAWPFPATLDLSGLSLAVGVALAQALDPGGSRIGIKWPNDLMLGAAMGVGTGEGTLGRKLAGILIETVTIGTQRVAVIGVGINVRELTCEAASSGLAWLAEIDAGATPATVLARVEAPVAEALRSFERAGFTAFAAGFAARDVLRGRRVQGGAAHDIEGGASGVSPTGELLVRTPTGLVPVRSGEVRLRIVGHTEAAAPC